MKRLFREVDEDGNGKVDFEEFLKLVRQRGKEATQRVNDMTKALGGVGVWGGRRVVIEKKPTWI